jgi:hypothetical protein
VAVAVDTALVTGGGSILRPRSRDRLRHHQPDLPGRTITALGLVATKNPDGSKGFSLPLIVTVEPGTPYVPFGFRLEGVGGGMLALHRRLTRAAMRAAPS